MAAPAIRKLKVLLVGDKATGKHCYVRRLMDNKYPRDSWTNKECDTWSLKKTIDENTTVSVQIFIIQGAARGKSVLKNYYKNIDGFIAMFDVTNPESYDNIPSWKANIDAEHKGGKLPPCILLANKSDLEKNDEINEQMQGINEYCEIYGFRAHFETSSKENIGIEQSFQHLIREIIQGPIPPTLGPDSQSRSRSSTTTSEPRPDQDLLRGRDRAASLVPQEYTIKIIVIGELATGKTALIQRYVRNVFSTYYRATIGADMGFKKVYHQNDIVNVHIWDIAGDERFGSMTQLFYKETAGCIIVFDESRSTTLHGAAKWKADFDNKVNYDPTNPVPCILVGNKCDLPKDGMIQSESHMKNFCQAHQFLRWFEASARDGTNVTDTFTYLIHQIMENISNRTGVRRRTPSDGTIRLSETLSPNDTKHTCCSN